MAIFCDECKAHKKGEVKGLTGISSGGQTEPVKLKCGEVSFEFHLKLVPKADVQLCQGCFAAAMKQIDFAELLAKGTQTPPPQQPR